MKILKIAFISVLSILVFITSTSVTYLVLERNEQHEQSTPKITQSSETSSTIEETQTTTTESSYSNETTQEQVTYQQPTFTPANTNEYTVGEYMGYDVNIQGYSYVITRNYDGVKGVLTIDNQANMEWYYYDAGGIHTNQGGD